MPYIIADETQLRALATAVNDGSLDTFGVYFALGGDIPLSNTEWTPIGDTLTTAEFKGNFDGGGYEISGLSIQQDKAGGTSYLGLFGRLNGAEISNLTVSGDITVTGNSGKEIYAGGLAGVASGSTLTDCVSGVIVSVTNNTALFAGGLVGCVYGGNVTDCSATGSVSATLTVDNSGAFMFAGGLLGITSATGIFISGCTASGTVSAKADYATGDNSGFVHAGGFIGENNGAGTITGCSASGNSTATGGANSRAGGFAGNNTDTLTGCFATGNATASGSFSENNAGGVAGYNFGSISGCYALGDVTASGGTDNYVGGIAGYNDASASVSGSYYGNDMGGTLGVTGNPGTGTVTNSGLITSDEAVFAALCCYRV